jgi:hypothetical protein
LTSTISASSGQLTRGRDSITFLGNLSNVFQGAEIYPEKIQRNKSRINPAIDDVLLCLFDISSEIDDCLEKGKRGFSSDLYNDFVNMVKDRKLPIYIFAEAVLKLFELIAVPQEGNLTSSCNHLTGRSCKHCIVHSHKKPDFDGVLKTLNESGETTYSLVQILQNVNVGLLNVQDSDIEVDEKTSKQLRQISRLAGVYEVRVKHLVDIEESSESLRDVLLIESLLLEVSDLRERIDQINNQTKNQRRYFSEIIQMQGSAINGLASSMEMEYTETNVPKLVDGNIVYKESSLFYQMALILHNLKILYSALTES